MPESTWFFDPTTCPSCRALLPAPRPGLICPQCAVALTGSTGIRLAEQLCEADRTLAQLRRERVRVGLPTPAVTFRPDRPAPAVPPITSPAPRSTGWISPAVILLGLGGLCLVVAAVVFLSMSWTALTLGQKVAILAAVTGLLGSAATHVTKKGLRGSAETLWAITYADLALDVFAARRADLLGLRSLPLHQFTSLGAGLVGVVAVAGLIALRPSRLTVSQLVVAVAGSTAIISMLTDHSQPSWFAPTVSVLGIAALALAARRAGWTITAVGAGSIAVLPWLQLVGTGIGQIIEGHYAGLLAHGRADDLPSAVVLAVVAAGAPRLLTVAWLRIPVATAGLVAFDVTVFATADCYLLATSALAVTLGSTVLIGLIHADVWMAASRTVVAALAAVAGPVLAASAGFGVLAGLGDGSGLWRRAFDHRLPDGTPAPTLALLGLLAVTAVAALRYLPGQPGWVGPVVLVSAVAISLNVHPPAWLGVLAWLLSGLIAGLRSGRVAGLRSGRVGGGRPDHLLPAAIAIALGLSTALPSDINTGWAFAIGALLTVAIAPRLTDPALRTAGELTGLAQLLVAVTAAVHTVSPQDGTPAVAGLLTVTAVSAVIALISPTRPWWQWLAFTAATGAIWIEAAVRQLHAPELYCIPLGVVVLAFGLHATHRRELSSWLAYGPGLLVLSAPTAVLALAEPLSWRAGAVGAAALAMVLSGSRRKLQSPLLIGAFELALLVLRELGPYALALPRWAGIAAIGLILLGVGITWENRLANLKHARRQLAELG